MWHHLRTHIVHRFRVISHAVSAKSRLACKMSGDLPDQFSAIVCEIWNYLGVINSSMTLFIENIKE